MRALVTGVRHDGIGGATARRLVHEARRRGSPARIALAATGRHPGLTAFADVLRAHDAHVTVLTGDLLDPGTPARLVAEAAEFCGGLDAVALNAGAALAAPLAEVSLESWDRTFALDARSVWLTASAAHPHLRASGGAIVATGSIAAVSPYPGLGAYGPAKAALVMLCQTLALEWAADGIRVNSVSPGPVRSGHTEPLYADPAEDRYRSSIIPLGRCGTPDDVAALVAFLLGPDARFITGENVLVDGGLARSALNRIGDRREFARAVRTAPLQPGPGARDVTPSP